MYIRQWAGTAMLIPALTTVGLYITVLCFAYKQWYFSEREWQRKLYADREWNTNENYFGEWIEYIHYK